MNLIFRRVEHKALKFLQLQLYTWTRSASFLCFFTLMHNVVVYCYLMNALYEMLLLESYTWFYYYPSSSEKHVGPTSFAPIIDAAIDIVEANNGQYHVLVIIADGQVHIFLEIILLL